MSSGRARVDFKTKRVPCWTVPDERYADTGMEIVALRRGNRTVSTAPSQWKYRRGPHEAPG